jgi:hypothetical protein
MHLRVTFLRFLERYAFTRRTEINTMAIIAHQKHIKEQKMQEFRPKQILRTHTLLGLMGGHNIADYLLSKRRVFSSFT